MVNGEFQYFTVFGVIACAYQPPLSQSKRKNCHPLKSVSLVSVPLNPLCYPSHFLFLRHLKVTTPREGVIFE